MKVRISRPLSIVSLCAGLALGTAASAEPSEHEHGHAAGGGMPMGMGMMGGEGDHGGMHCQPMSDDDMEHMAEHMKSLTEGMAGCHMMGGHMQKMRSMMHDMMTMMTSHVGDRLDALKADLKITDAQLPQWNSFADAVRSAAKAATPPHDEEAPKAEETPQEEAPVYSGARSYPDAGAIKKTEAPAAEAAAPAQAKPSAPKGLLAHLEHHEKSLTEHLESLKAIKAALNELYGSFSDEQKKIADGLTFGPGGAL